MHFAPRHCMVNFVWRRWEKSQMISWCVILSAHKRWKHFMVTNWLALVENCLAGMIISREKDLTQMRICMKGKKMLLMRAAFSFAARRPGHEVHKEQGQNKNCPFSMGVLEICSRGGAAHRVLLRAAHRVWCFWNVFAIVLMKNGRNCTTRLQSPVVAKSIQIPSNSSLSTRRRRILGKKGGK